MGAVAQAQSVPDNPVGNSSPQARESPRFVRGHQEGKVVRIGFQMPRTENPRESQVGVRFQVRGQKPAHVPGAHAGRVAASCTLVCTWAQAQRVAASGNTVAGLFYRDGR